MSRTFSVKVSSADTVHDLKEVIDAKKSPRFDDIAADELILWRQVKRHRDKDHGVPTRKRFKANATIYKEVRKYVYYVDQRKSNEPLITVIQRGGFVQMYGSRASGKSSRILEAMDTLTEDGYECMYVDLQGTDTTCEENFWVGLNRELRIFRLPLEFNNSTGFLEAFSARHNRWDRPVVIFFDEFDKLLQDNSAYVCSSVLEIIRHIRNNSYKTGEHRKYVIHSIVSIGTYATLRLNQTQQAFSPFNTSENFQNESLSMDQVLKLYQEFAKDRSMTIDDRVIEDIFLKTNGHAGLVNICGVAIEKYFVNLRDLQRFDIDHWGDVQNILLSEMQQYGTFEKLVTDLTGKSEKQVTALSHYRSHYLGSTSEVVKSSKRNFEDYLAALGVLQPEANGFKIASPLMDSFIRQIVIPEAYPTAPSISLPAKPDDSLDILGIFKSTLSFFDKELIAEAHKLSYKVATVPVNNGRNQRVPRESVYDSEMIRICSNWLSRIEYKVIGQRHIGNLYCDIVLQEQNSHSTVLELVVTETIQQIHRHIERTVNYKNVAEQMRDG
ncbi:hypothetical protein EC973_003028 [Apophysomyces ossiformis]|uniref:Crinkler effector protein N-terminal domain-containing protein n=1 Tax=Apophysomyces ossiformis TaxID=679940 RepID=A0A8H7ESY8_9FUNG|nr:hypothetical protein EC973_003028 [Apophysomyces ossiformis]